MRHNFFLLMPLFIFCSSVYAKNNTLPCTDNYEAAASTAQRIENEWPLRSSGDEITRYVQKLGVHLAQLKGYGDAFAWRFSVVRNLTPNAFSIGNGYVFVTEGAINFAESESELAAIIAHELGHELAGHFCKTPTQGSFPTVLDDLFIPKKNEQYRAGVGSLTQVIDVKKELQADRIALSIMKAGGYDIRSMLKLAKRLPSNSRTHLIDASRVQALEKIIPKFPVQSIQDSPDFTKIKRLLKAQ